MRTAFRFFGSSLFTQFSRRRLFSTAADWRLCPDLLPPVLASSVNNLTQLTSQINENRPLDTLYRDISERDGDELARFQLFTAYLICHKPLFAMKYLRLLKCDYIDNRVIEWLLHEFRWKNNHFPEAFSNSRPTSLAMIDSKKTRDLVEGIFNLAPGALKLDKRVFNAGMEYFVVNFDYNAALRLGEKMLKYGIDYDVKTISLLLKSAYKVGNIAKANEIQAYCDTKGLKFDRILYVTIITGMLKNKYYDDAKKTFDKMAEIFPPQAVELNLLLHMQALTGETNLILNTWKLLGKYGYNSVSYSTLMNCFCNANNVSAVEIIFQYVTINPIPSARRRSGIIIDTKLGPLLENYVNSSIENDISKINFLKDTIPTLPPDQLKSLSLYYWNILLKCYVRSRRYREAEQLYSLIYKFSKPDWVSYNLMLEMGFFMNDLNLVSESLEKLSGEGVAAYDYTLNYILKLHLKNNNISAFITVMRLYVQMSKDSQLQNPKGTTALRHLLKELSLRYAYAQVCRNFEYFSLHFSPCLQSCRYHLNALVQARRISQLVQFIDSPLVKNLLLYSPRSHCTLFYESALSSLVYMKEFDVFHQKLSEYKAAGFAVEPYFLTLIRRIRLASA